MKILRILEFYLLCCCSRIKLMVNSRVGGGCPVCRSKVKFYKPYGTRKLRIDAECPICRAAERERLESIYLNKINNYFNKNKMKILHFAPENCIYNAFFANYGDLYWPVDIDEAIPIVRKRIDIMDIDFEDETFDLIICNHVLEHVNNANIAIKEITRVIKSDGICIITVPIDEKHATLEDDRINTDKLRIKYYGEANHVRMFGNDFEDILRKNGLQTEKIFARDLLAKEELRMAGLKSNEYFWLCKKIK